MATSSHLTVGELAKFYDLPTWKIRRAVDSLNVEIPRAGSYRLIPRSMLGLVSAELQRRGYLQVQEAAPCQ